MERAPPWQSTLGVNVYAYCLNQPTNRTDPLGLDSNYSQLSDDTKTQLINLGLLVPRPPGDLLIGHTSSWKDYPAVDFYCRERHFTMVNEVQRAPDHICVWNIGEGRFHRADQCCPYCCGPYCWSYRTFGPGGISWDLLNAFGGFWSGAVPYKPINGGTFDRPIYRDVFHGDD